MKKYIAEGLGAFALALTVALSIRVGFAVTTPILAALVLGIFVYTIGPISGSHINPAVTLGALSIGKISRRDAIMYIVAQFVGGLLALIVAKISLGAGLPPAIAVANTGRVLLAEIVGTAFFTFGIASVVYGKTPGAQSGFVVGGSLLLGIALAAMMGSAGLLNPAVALGVNAFGVMYILGPIIGSVLGMQAYKYLSHNH